MPGRPTDAIEHEEKYEGSSMQQHKDEQKQMMAQSKPQFDRRPSRELELREVFEHTDFSEKAGTPAERLARMSKAANDLTREREEQAAAKQKEEDAEFWEIERRKASSSGPAEKDTQIKGSQLSAPSKAAEKGAQPAAVESKPKGQIDKPGQLQRTHDDDDDHSSEMPSERSSKLDRPAASEKLSLQQRHERSLKPSSEVEALNATRAERKQWHAEMGREKDDPDNHIRDRRETLREELQHEADRLFRRDEGTRKEERFIPTALHVPTMLRMHSGDQHARELDRRVRGDSIEERAFDEPPPSIERDLFKINGEMPDIRGTLSGAKSSVGEKLIHWKDEAAAKLTGAKDKAVHLKDDAKSKAGELREEASDKAAELKQDVRSKKDEIVRDIDSKRADIKEDLRDAKESTERRVDSASSSLRSKAHTISSDIKSEVRDDLDLMKRKMDEIGGKISHKKEEVKDKIDDVQQHHTRVDVSNRPKAEEQPSGMFEKMTSWWPASSWRKGEQREEGQRHHPTTLVTGASGTIFPTHRWSRDPDIKDMDRKLEELRAAEAGRGDDTRKGDPLRSKLSDGWHHIQSDMKSGDHDWVREADQASAQDMDNAPTSPRSWTAAESSKSWRSESRLQRSLPHPSSFSPSLSDVSPSVDVIPHIDRSYSRTRSPIASSSPAASPVAVRGGGFFAGFDPVIMDAAVEPW